MREEKPILRLETISGLSPFDTPRNEPLLRNARLSYNPNNRSKNGSGSGTPCNFACLSVAEKREQQRDFAPTPAQLLNHPLAALSAYVPKDAAIFAAGAIAGAAAKTVTAPLDRIKLLMQTHGVRAGQESAKKAIGFVEAIVLIGKDEGLKGYWKGNLPQVIRVVPYSAVQLFAYETYKKLFKGKDGELSVIGRLAAGACAGMTSTFITYPLDVLRLRLAVEPGYRTMSEVALTMLREEGFASFYYGLGPSLLGIAPYIAVNFCIFDLVKKALPEEYRQKTQASLLTAVVSAACATLTCYPLDTVRRQMQMRGTPYKSVLEAIPGIIERDGVIGLYRGFLPNALKNLPNSRKSIETKRGNLQILYASKEGQEEPQTDRISKSEDQVILVERYGSGTVKRYIVDDDLQIRTFLEKHDSRSNELQSSDLSDPILSWLPDILKDFVFPAGFPGSVSDDYLQYLLLQLPTNVTGWICHTLVTSSLLKAVGVGSFSGTTAAASAAAIRWVSKDGIGALGRLFIGGRFGNLFDDDPKQWRMYADFIGSAGSIFDLTTQVYPAYFLPLASLGNLAKAVARGLKDPSFRVIQNHFAISGNLGEVAAKEEVWEVTAQLLGLSLGILILDTPGLVKSYPVLVSTWASIRLLHLWLRYLSLSALRFNTINLKRARILVKSHVLHSRVPGCNDCNKEENILSWQRFIKPRIVFGVPMEEILGGGRSTSMLKSLLRMYAREEYILTVNQQRKDFEVFVSFKVGATSVSVLRSVWQTYWLHEYMNNSENIYDQLAKSLSEMNDRFEEFIQQLDKAGWDTDQINIRVPNEISIDECPV
ncbi:Endoplasmic reticulum-adenine nucleotide transporter [Corchorus capsularis]|uniref:Endoplasmic reticulum-adenine nucleotide transporter n=1 Tax=Corchorus capsularis TaxID=210143 RepID=A0A1R3IR84_COCAP|nr:Endoplasmic reticulum-adenine nucleotide transporter [Corchorus capsularis]